MEGTRNMHIYKKIYEFAASAGSFEGYVYHRTDLDMNALPNWIDNLVSAYCSLPPEVASEFQASLDQTMGRAIRSVSDILGKNHDLVRKLRTMITGAMPASPDDFEKKKWFREQE